MIINENSNKNGEKFKKDYLNEEIEILKKKNEKLSILNECLIKKLEEKNASIKKNIKKIDELTEIKKKCDESTDFLKLKKKYENLLKDLDFEKESNSNKEKKLIKLFEQCKIQEKQMKILLKSNKNHDSKIVRIRDINNNDISENAKNENFQFSFDKKENYSLFIDGNNEKNKNKKADFEINKIKEFYDKEISYLNSKLKKSEEIINLFKKKFQQEKEHLFSSVNEKNMQSPLKPKNLISSDKQFENYYTEKSNSNTKRNFFDFPIESKLFIKIRL